SHLPFALFLVRTIALSIVSTWLYNGTRRSLLFVLLFHASLNTWPNTLYILEPEGALGPYISTSILYCGWALMLVLLGLTPGRRGHRGGGRSSPLAVASRPAALATPVSEPRPSPGGRGLRSQSIAGFQPGRRRARTAGGDVQRLGVRGGGPPARLSDCRRPGLRRRLRGVRCHGQSPVVRPYRPQPLLRRRLAD